MHFDRFDICAAHYLFAAEWHEGQGSRLYAKFAQLERVGFRPGPMLSTRSLSENAREILARLIRQERARQQAVRERRVDARISQHLHHRQGR